MSVAEIIRKCADRLAQNPKVVQNPSLDQLVGFKRFLVSRRAFFDSLDGFENVKQSITIASHNRTAC